ncbi:MAG: hypothetical protein ABGY96_27270 [bacterium]
MSNKLLEGSPELKEFRKVDNLPYSQIERQVGLYRQKGRLLSVTARQFVDQCSVFWAESSSTHQCSRNKVAFRGKEK